MYYSSIYYKKNEENTIEIDNFVYKIEKYYNYEEAWLIRNKKYGETDIVIPDEIVFHGNIVPVVRVEENCFEKSSIKKIIFGKKIQVIGKKCFNECKELETISFPDSLLRILENAFSGCTSLKKLILPNNIIALGDYCFHNCESLYEVVFPNNLSTIGKDCFSGCQSLIEVDLPENIKLIGEHCFAWCHNLATLRLPSNLEKLAGYAFIQCKMLKSLEIPKSVKSIGSGCFHGCDSLKQVLIPSNVKDVDSWAFESCSSLESVTIESTNTKIRRDCFSNCPALQQIIFPSSDFILEDICVDQCIKLNEETLKHIIETEEGRKRIKERSLGYKIKKTLKDLGSGAMSILFILLIAPFALLAYLIFAYVGTFVVGTVQIIGIAAILAFIIGFGIMFILQLLFKFEHKIDAVYIIACIAIGGLILCLFLFLS